MNDHPSTARKIIDFFIPTPVTPLLWLIVSLLILSLLNYNLVWQTLFGSYVGDLSREDFLPLTERFVIFQDKLSTPFLMLLWGGIGGFVYGVLWFGRTLSLLVKREIDSSHYLKGGAVRQAAYWPTTLKSNILLIGSLIGWIAYLVFYLRYLLPACSSLFSESLYYVYPKQLVACVLLNMVALYGLLMAERFLRYMWRVNRPGA